VALLPGADRVRAELYRAEVEGQLSRSGLTDSQSGASVPVVVSLGLAVYPFEGESADTLLRLADASMYAAKRQHQGGAVSMGVGRSDERAAATVGELLPLLTSPGKLEDKLRLVSQRVSAGSGYEVVMFETYADRDVEPAATNTFADISVDLVDSWNQEQRGLTRRPLEDVFMRTRRAVVLDDPGNDVRLTEAQRTIIRAADLHSAVSVPMFWQDQLVGSLNVACKRANAFTPADVQFLTSVANQVTALLRMATLVDDLALTSSRLAQSQSDAIILLAAAAEAHDQGTGSHLQRVKVVATCLARELGYSEEDADALGMAAVLHDIGKIRVPDTILASPAQLSDVEWAMMKQHTVWGADFLLARPGFDLAATVARAHHERWDGTGYPAGLAAEEIPLAAAIVSVADALDAMTNDRPYRAGRSIEWAVGEIQAAAGAQFSPCVVEALSRMHARGDLHLSKSEGLDIAA
jgi:HD-GYP domain-containing protein (c-di-GMP phosphodiesterase class II)